MDIPKEELLISEHLKTIEEMSEEIFENYNKTECGYYKSRKIIMH